MPVDNRGSRPVERQRAIIWNCKVEGGVDSRKWDLLAKDMAIACCDCTDVISFRYPAPQAQAFVPITPDLVLVV